MKKSILPKFGPQAQALIRLGAKAAATTSERFVREAVGAWAATYLFDAVSVEEVPEVARAFGLPTKEAA